MRSKVPKGATVIRLDEAGDNVRSGALADKIGGWRDAGVPELVFMIGGASGYGERLAQSYPQQIAFGAQTWPHRLIKIMLAEQLYRAATLLAGHPYHKP